MDPARELLKQGIDRADSVVQHLSPMNVQSLKSLLPDIIKDLKAGFVSVTGENPWEQTETPQ
jgi:hypothetical protein